MNDENENDNERKDDVKEVQEDEPEKQEENNEEEKEKEIEQHEEKEEEEEVIKTAKENNSEEENEKINKNEDNDNENKENNSSIKVNSDDENNKNEEDKPNDEPIQKLSQDDSPSSQKQIEIDSLKTEISSLLMAVSSLQKTIFTLQSQNQTLSEKLTETQSALESALTENLSKAEVEKAFTLFNDKTQSRLNAKLTSTKAMIKELHQKYEDELNQKDKLYQQQVALLKNEMQNWNKKEEEYKSTTTLLEKHNNAKIKTINELSQNKEELEAIVIKQEDKLKLLAQRVAQIETLLHKKDKMLKENEICSEELKNIIEKQQQIIQRMKLKNELNDTNSYITQDNPLFKKNGINSENISYDYGYNLGYGLSQKNRKSPKFVLPPIKQRGKSSKEKS